ncbi:aspartate 1-decarboxylase [Marinicrinis sediminis]|uniref:Aspartate 1-decarboxylase n=1 Tax=Marinicrinis sediminis TaxID=1652465 RepID=A0ABW5RA91_9BACL
MYKTMMYAKLHRAIVTEANLNYVGSITIDQDLLDVSGIQVNERVQVVNNHNGERIETYVIPGERGSGTICLNGAAARRFQPDDVVIIMAYAILSEEEIREHHPKVVILEGKNEIREVWQEETHSTVV